MSNLGPFIWGIADQLRGDYKPHEYGDVILPMTILRRLDCVLEDHREDLAGLVRAFADKPELLSAQVKRKTGLSFYNTTPWTLQTLLGDPAGLEANFKQYVDGFSDNLDVFERFKFGDQIARMAEKDLLFIIIEKFARVDLHPNKVPNAEMGDLYEYLIRTFNESTNESPGEYFTPRDAIRLMVDLVFAGDDDALSVPGTVRSIYDPTAGTGGMLSIAEEHLIGTPEHPGLNPDAQLRMYGQERNDQSYAVCKSDLLIKGHDPSNIQLGDTLADDRFPAQTFDYCLSNPPYGDDWKKSQSAVTAEIKALGAAARFIEATPPISDGQLLFLQHLIHKLRPKKYGGGRGAIVLNAASTYGGNAGAGPSEIRRHLISLGIVDSIIALPTNMFYNTELATYIWIVDTNRPKDREYTILLIDARNLFTRMRKKLGDKVHLIDEENRSRIVKAYVDYESSNISRIVPTSAFHYVSAKLKFPEVGDDGEIKRRGTGKVVEDKGRAIDLKLPIHGDISNMEIAIHRTVDDFMENEVDPRFDGCWIDATQAKVGCEIAFEQFFFQPESYREEAEIMEDLKIAQTELIDLIERMS